MVHNTQKRNKDRVLYVVGYAFVTLFFIATLYPLLQTLIISVKPSSEFNLNPMGLPSEISLSNYINAWAKGNFSQLFMNSVIVTFFTIVFIILVAAPAAFSLSKLKVKGEKFLYNYFILGMIVPFQVIMIPLLKYARGLGMINKLSSLIIVYAALGLAFPIIIYTSFYKSVPNELLEAARIDGCSIFGAFWRIIFPMTSTINVTVCIFAGLQPWQDFFVPLIFSNDNSAKTLPLGMFNFSSQFFTDWTVVFAAIVIQSLPMIILYLVMQKKFISGITAGAVKG